MAGGRRGPSPLTGKRELYRRLMEQGMDNSAALSRGRDKSAHRYPLALRAKADQPCRRAVGVPTGRRPAPTGTPAPSRFSSELERTRIADHAPRRRQLR